jgi:hypothetical protein
MKLPLQCRTLARHPHHWFYPKSGLYRAAAGSAGVPIGVGWVSRRRNPTHTVPHPHPLCNVRMLGCASLTQPTIRPNELLPCPLCCTYSIPPFGLLHDAQAWHGRLKQLPEFWRFFIGMAACCLPRARALQREWSLLVTSHPDLL